MSNISHLPKMLKFRSINPIAISNIRQLVTSTSCGREQYKPTEKDKYITRNGTILHQNGCEIHFVEQQNYRSLHKSSLLWKGTNDDSTKSVKIDQFRAEEEKIEREYEEQEKQKQDQQSTSSSTEDHDKVQKVRAEILEASLQFVPTHGWSVEAIAHGAESIKYPGVAHGMFPNGSIELIHHFYTKCNRELIEKLQQEFNELTEKSGNGEQTVERPSPRDFAIRAIRLRLEMIVPYKETWPQALGIMTLPQNVPMVSMCLSF